MGGKPSSEEHGISTIEGLKWPGWIVSSEQLAALRALPCRPDDVFVATWPKAGTHWVAKICNLILEHDQFLFPLEFNRWDQLPMQLTCWGRSSKPGPVWHGKGKGKGEDGRLKYSMGPPFMKLAWDDVPSPRIFASHVPIDFLPAGSANARTVYVSRDVKDCIVSMADFSVANPWATAMTLDETVRTFVEGNSFDAARNTAAGAIYGGLPYHAKGYVDAAAAGRSIHFINYDRLKQDPEGEIRKLARYLGVDLSAARVTAIREQTTFQAMKTAAAAEEEAKGRGKGAVGRMILGEPMEWSRILYRQGERGDGKKRLSAEQARAVDEACKPAMKEIGHLFA